MNISKNLIHKNISFDSQQKNLVTQKEKIISYYENAGPDYEIWSKGYNMHFGYFQKGINPFNRESMLEALNQQVLDRLKLSDDSGKTLADFGCGLGATLRSAAMRYSDIKLKGVTLVPWQVDQAKEQNSRDEKFSNIEIIMTDYCNSGFESNSLDAVIAIESSCYAEGNDKSDLLKEIYRVLKPGGKFVISDGFLKHGAPLKGLLGQVYHQLCNSWALVELGNIEEVKECLLRLGFQDLKIDDISWNVAPSVAHVPFTVLYFLLKEFMYGKKGMNVERWNNLKSPLLTMILGLARQHFGYYMISGRK